LAPGRLRDAIPNVFGGAITVRPNSRLHLGRSRGRLSVGPEAHNGNSGSNGGMAALLKLRRSPQRPCRHREVPCMCAGSSD